MFISFTPLGDLSLVGLLRKKRLLTVEQNLVVREQRRIADLRNKLAIDGARTETLRKLEEHYRQRLAQIEAQKIHIARLEAEIQRAIPKLALGG